MMKWQLTLFRKFLKKTKPVIYEDLSKYFDDEYRFGSFVRGEFHEYFDLQNGPWIGGGFVRSLLEGKKPRDVDIFFKNKEQYDAIYPKIKNKYAKKYKLNPVAFLCFDSWKDVVDSFDFTCCLGITDGKSFIIHKDFMDAVTNKILKFHDDKNYSTSVVRVAKYLLYGYSPEPGFISKVLHIETDWKEHLKNGYFVTDGLFENES